MSNRTELRISGQGISSFLLLLCIALGFWFQGSSAGFQDSEHEQILAENLKQLKTTVVRLSCYLAELEQTSRPASNIRSFCNQHQLTLPSLFQVAWGLVLRYYAGSDNVSMNDNPL
jgi:hypothetical protein